MIQLGQQHELEHELEKSPFAPCDEDYRGDGSPYLPSREEIEAHCREIRRGWSEAEHRRRAGFGVNRLQMAVKPVRLSLPSSRDSEQFS